MISLEKNSTTNACTLCSSLLPSHFISEDDHQFCCMGCRAVFNILTAKDQLQNYQNHPIFLQALRSGIISNPDLLEHIQKQKENFQQVEKERFYIEIADMWCPSCAEVIRLMLLRKKGVFHCVVDYSTDLVSIEFAPRYLSKEQLLNIIKELGYHPSSLDVSDRKAIGTNLYLRFIIAAFCSLNAMMFAYPIYTTYFNYDGEEYGKLFAWLSLISIIPVISYSAWPIWRRLWSSLKFGIMGMETLVAIGVVAACGLSLYELLWVGGTRVYFDSMSVIIVFVLLGKMIEAKAKFSAKEALLHLTKSTPKRGRKRFEDGEVRFVLLKEVKKGGDVSI